MITYISGPITGVPDYAERFRQAEEYLNSHGQITHNPAEFEARDWAWRDYMRRDIGLLMECDTIYMLDGWRDSKGARLEHHIATELGFDITYQAPANVRHGNTADSEGK